MQWMQERMHESMQNSLLAPSDNVYVCVHVCILIVRVRVRERERERESVSECVDAQGKGR